jgi:hypothetical protein
MIGSGVTDTNVHSPPLKLFSVEIRNNTNINHYHLQTYLPRTYLPRVILNIYRVYQNSELSDIFAILTHNTLFSGQEFPLKYLQTSHISVSETPLWRSIAC